MLQVLDIRVVIQSLNRLLTRLLKEPGPTSGPPNDIVKSFGFVLEDVRKDPACFAIYMRGSRRVHVEELDE